MGILVSAFEAFDGDASNITDDVLQAISTDESIKEDDVSLVTLPVSRADALPTLIDAIAASKPDTIVCLGQANDRSEITVEKLAVNHCCYRIPDNQGEQPDDEPVIVGGPAAYFATLPVNKLVERLNTDGVSASVSYSAGTYVCNSVFFGLMHYIEESLPGTRGGFIHIPRGSPGELAEMTRAVKLLIRCLSDEGQIANV